MSQLFAFLISRFRPYLSTLAVLVFVLVVVAVVYYAYQYIVKPKTEANKFKDVANNGPSDDVVTIYMFHVDWCPHCKRAMPQWELFQTEYNGQTVNGTKVSCQAVDCTNTDDTEVQAIMDKYNVKQYPTVIAILGSSNLRIDFDGKVKKEHLEQFVQSVTAKH
jgi:thiol-disulfide isomerase/thioredoxin